MATVLKEITLDDVKDILGRALIDAAFREALKNDARATLLILGFDNSDDSIAFFESLVDNDFSAAADTVENRLGGRPVIALWL